VVERERLAVIAARRADHAVDMRPLALEPVEIDEPAAHLEGADRRVVLVLDHDFCADAGGEQRPNKLRRFRHRRAHDGQDRSELGESEHGLVLWMMPFTDPVFPDPASHSRIEEHRRYEHPRLRYR
jgi:hypothetical protein